MHEFELATFENFIGILRIRSGKKLPRVVKHSQARMRSLKPELAKLTDSIARVSREPHAAVL